MTFEELTEEMRPMHNHIGLYGDSELVRLLGVAEDAQDYYYIIASYQGRVIWGSAVGAFESLKGKLERYAIAENIFTLNGCPPSETFSIEQKL